MRINTNVSSLNTQRILGKTGTQLAQNIGRLSSGFRINRAADDAAGLGVANKLRSDIRALQQAARNAEQGTALLQIAEGATQTIGNIVDRMKELAAQAASANSGDRAGLQAEFELLSEEIDRIVDTTKYQDVELLRPADPATPLNFLVSASGDYAAADNANFVSLDVVDLSALGLGALDLETAAATALDTLDTAVETINGALSDIGAAQNRLDFAYENVRTTIENYAAAESTIRDADMAAEMSTFTKNQILQQAGTAMLAQANAAPQSILRLLQ
ncbi:MAG: flagellin N-terminal helical domain-containing protein [Longimicrobiales bacterium]